MSASLGKDALYPKKEPAPSSYLFVPGSALQPSSFSFGKRTQTMVAVAWPFGCPASFADPGGAQTRGVYPEPTPKGSNNARLPPNPAARLGLATRPRDSNYGLIFRDESRQHQSCSCGFGTWYVKIHFSFPSLPYPTPADRLKGRTLW